MHKTWATYTIGIYRIVSDKCVTCGHKVKLKQRFNKVRKGFEELKAHILGKEDAVVYSVQPMEYKMSNGQLQIMAVKKTTSYG